MVSFITYYNKSRRNYRCDLMLANVTMFLIREAITFDPLVRFYWVRGQFGVVLEAQSNDEVTLQISWHKEWNDHNFWSIGFYWVRGQINTITNLKWSNFIWPHSYLLQLLHPWHLWNMKHIGQIRDMIHIRHMKYIGTWQYWEILVKITTMITHGHYWF